MTKVTYYCQMCGNSTYRWTGRCAACGTWDSVVGDTVSTKKHLPTGACGASAISLGDSSIDHHLSKLCTGVDELDRVFGGGIVPGSSILIGGEPGIGKSTLMLQVASILARKSCGCLYASGEESVGQIKARAGRLGILEPTIKVIATSSLTDILEATKRESVQCLIVDSIQTIYDEEISSSPGTVVQVRMCAHKLATLVRQRGIALFVLGQITKEGLIAGPKTLEHMVDTVLYFEGNNGDQLRILRTVKNRFGPANEIGVFEMSDHGLIPASNPSLLFLGQSASKGIVGNIVFAGIEGSRPILVEVQSLISNTYMPSPRRAVVGWDLNRLAMIIAVLNARCDVFLADKEVYLNIAGGLKICEPAADLAIAASLVSSLTKISTPPSTVMCGEVALSGEIRNIANVDLRMKEAYKLGFRRAIIPKGSRVGLPMEVTEVGHIREIKKFFS